MTRRGRIWLFLLIAYGLSSSVGLLLWALNVPYRGLTQLLVGSLTMFSPGIAALIVQKRCGGSEAVPLGAKPRWSIWLVWAAFLGMGVSLVVALVGGLFPGVHFVSATEGILSSLSASASTETLEEVRKKLEAMPVPPLLLLLPQALIAGATVNALFAFGEELGWRGFLHAELKSLGFWRASFVTGVCWGFWHAPLILNGHNYPTQRVSGVFLFTVVCVLLSPLHAFVRERSKSVWGAAVMHGTINASAGLSTLVTIGGGELLVGLSGAAGVIGLVLVNLVLFFWLRRQAANEPLGAVGSIDC